MNITVLCTILFHQTVLPVFLRTQGKRFIFLKKSYGSISELQKWWASKIQKWQQFEVAPLHFEQIFTIPLISKNNEFAEAYLDVRSHHPFLPVSDLLAYLSELKCFFFSPPPSLLALALAWFCPAELLRQWRWQALCNTNNIIQWQSTKNRLECTLFSEETVQQQRLQEVAAGIYLSFRKQLTVEKSHFSPFLTKQYPN